MRNIFPVLKENGPQTIGTIPFLELPPFYAFITLHQDAEYSKTNCRNGDEGTYAVFDYIILCPFQLSPYSLNLLLTEKKISESYSSIAAFEMLNKKLTLSILLFKLVVSVL